MFHVPNLSWILITKVASKWFAAFQNYNAGKLGIIHCIYSNQVTISARNRLHYNHSPSIGALERWNLVYSHPSEVNLEITNDRVIHSVKTLSFGMLSLRFVKECCSWIFSTKCIFFWL